MIMMKIMISILSANVVYKTILQSVKRVRACVAGDIILFNKKSKEMEKVFYFKILYFCESRWTANNMKNLKPDKIHHNHKIYRFH